MSCSTGACVIITFDGDNVLVTDSKFGATSPVLTYSRAEWQRNVVDEIQAGGWLPGMTYRNSRGETVMRRQIGGVELYFTEPEWKTFIDDVRAGKYDVDTETATTRPGE